MSKSKVELDIGDKVEIMGRQNGGWGIGTIGIISEPYMHRTGGLYWWISANNNRYYHRDDELKLVTKAKPQKKTKEKCIVYGTNNVVTTSYDRYKVPKATPLSQRAISEAYQMPDSRPIGDKIGNKDTGIIKSKRTFGCEVECVAPNYLTRKTAPYLMPKEFGYGGDGSIRTTGSERSVEFKTAPLYGKLGEETLIKFCSLLKDSGYKTNTSCGGHCHIGIPEAFGEKDNEKVQKKLKNLLLLLTVIEPAILSLLPKDRRGNSFCGRISDRYVVFKDIKSLQSNDFKKETQFDHFWYNTKNESTLKSYKSAHSVRSRDGFNFNSIGHRGTLEIRFHEGTLDSERLIHWMALHSAIVDIVMDNKLKENDILSLKKIDDVEELLNRLLEILGDRLDKSTVKYTLTRFKQYKKLNPKDGYITRVFVKDPAVAQIRSETEDYEGLSYIGNDIEDDSDWDF